MIRLELPSFACSTPSSLASKTLHFDFLPGVMELAAIAVLHGGWTVTPGIEIESFRTFRQSSAKPAKSCLTNCKRVKMDMSAAPTLNNQFFKFVVQIPLVSQIQSSSCLHSTAQWRAAMSAMERS